MIQLDKQVSPVYGEDGKITGWRTQAVLLPNHFFLNPNITYDWIKNTCTLDDTTYYLDKVLDKASTLVAIPSEGEWMNTYGNNILHEYYKGATANNPTGNVNNVYRSTYVDSRGRTKYIFEYAYDGNDNCISQKSVAPTGADSRHDIVYVTASMYSHQQLVKQINFESGITAEIPQLQSTDEEIFGGWMKDGQILPVVSSMSIFVIRESCDLVAVWYRRTTLRLYDGERLVEERRYDERDVYVPDQILPDTDTKAFGGWARDGEKVSGEIPMTEDVVLTAIWIDKEEGE